MVTLSPRKKKGRRRQVEENFPKCNGHRHQKYVLTVREKIYLILFQDVKERP